MTEMMHWRLPYRKVRKTNDGWLNDTQIGEIIRSGHRLFHLLKCLCSYEKTRINIRMDIWYILLNVIWDKTVGYLLFWALVIHFHVVKRCWKMNRFWLITSVYMTYNLFHDVMFFFLIESLNKSLKRGFKKVKFYW